MVSQRKGESRETYLERKRKDYQEHKKEANVYSRKYHQEHKKEDNARSIRYYQNHIDEMIARKHEYDQEHKEEAKARCRKYQREHPVMVAKCHAKQKGFGYIPLNEWFGGCHSHHIDMDQVIYIPAKLHMSVDHNMTTGKGMEEINALALAYWAGSEMT